MVHKGERIELLRKVVSGITLTLMLIGMLTLAFNIQPVKASGGTIYIRADGSIDPPDAPISTVDNVTYTFTTDIYDGVVVEKDSIVINGAGYTLQGTGAYYSKGIELSGRINVTVTNTTIKNFDYGIWLDSSSNYNSVSGNNITNNGGGIRLSGSSNYNSVSGNNITNNWAGIDLVYSSNNSIAGNNITNNDIGIWLYSSSNYNSVSGNNITNNGGGISLSSSSNNSIAGNNITANNWAGIDLDLSSNNSIAGNNITNNENGIWLDSSSNYNSVSGNTITNNGGGISLGYSSNNSIAGNNITANTFSGIGLGYSSNNSIAGNNITNNRYGIGLGYSSNYNSVSGNTITNNWYGIRLDSSSNNIFYLDNFVNNTQQVYSSDSINVWDDGYPSGGNYWSDYTGVDLYSGPYQNETGSDGIGDTPYVIDERNQDNYPLMEPWTPKPPTPLEALEELIQTVQSYNLDTGIENSLTSKLQAANRSLDRGNQNAAVGQLTAFINEAEALRGKKLTNDKTDYLLSEAQRIIDLIKA